MRYLLHKSQLNEMSARKDYLYDIFHLYFLPRHLEGDYTPLIPLGENGPDILFITGHTQDIHKYLSERICNIPEKIILITSCFGNSFKKYSDKKDIYIPAAKQEVCNVRNGEMYGFDFNISAAELDFYNCKGDIYQRINVAYKML